MQLPELFSSGARLCAFRRPSPDAPRASALSILQRIALGLALEGLESFLLNGRPGHLEWQALPDLLFPLGILLFCAWIATVLIARPDCLASLFADLLAARVLLLAADLLLEGSLRVLPEDARLDQWMDGALNGLQVWWLLAVLVRIGHCARVGRPRLLLAWSAFAGPWLVLLVLFPPADLWQADAPADEAEAPASALSEDVFHTQPGLFDDALDALRPERPGVDDLYFVGVAGDAGTSAFRNEVELADHVLGERFDTSGRSLLLVNDARPEPTRPFATRTNLEAALEHLADVMDVDDDILLLFLSSHGTREHTVVLAQPGLALGDIEPAGLRRALDEAGIRWRIVIVSACYSGAFVDALRDDHTLVMTASDAEHPSFGCGTADRYTWFGQAVFDQALRHTLSFTDAFRIAAKAIAARERATHETPSNPQLFVGAAMGPKLAALQLRLSQPGGPAGSVQAAMPANALAWAGVAGLSARHAGHAGAPRYAGMSGVSEHASTCISSLRRSLRFLSRRNPSSSMSLAVP